MLAHGLLEVGSLPWGPEEPSMHASGVLHRWLRSPILITDAGFRGPWVPRGRALRVGLDRARPQQDRVSAGRWGVGVHAGAVSSGGGDPAVSAMRPPLAQALLVRRAHGRGAPVDPSLASEHRTHAGRVVDGFPRPPAAHAPALPTTVARVATGSQPAPPLVAPYASTP